MVQWNDDLSVILAGCVWMSRCLKKTYITLFNTILYYTILYYTIQILYYSHHYNTIVFIAMLELFELFFKIYLLQKLSVGCWNLRHNNSQLNYDFSHGMIIFQSYVTYQTDISWCMSTFKITSQNAHHFHKPSPLGAPRLSNNSGFVEELKQGDVLKKHDVTLLLRQKLLNLQQIYFQRNLSPSSVPQAVDECHYMQTYKYNTK